MFRVASVRVMNLIKLLCKAIVKAKDLRVYACLREREEKEKANKKRKRKKENCWEQDSNRKPSLFFICTLWCEMIFPVEYSFPGMYGSQLILEQTNNEIEMHVLRAELRIGPIHRATHFQRIFVHADTICGISLTCWSVYKLLSLTAK